MRELTDLEHEMLQSARWLDLSHHRGELLKELHARAQRLEAALVLVEDQRNKAQSQRDGFLADLERVIAERDILRKQLDNLRNDYTDKSYWGKE